MSSSGLWKNDSFLCIPRRWWFVIEKYCFITARIRRMREGNIFSLFSSVGGGGGTHLADGGYPFPGPGGEIPLSQVQLGVPLCQEGWGYPPSGSMGVPLPLSGRMGVPLPISQMGYCPPHLPIQVRSRTPYRHSVYFLRGGRYASCVHAGGFSCFY